MCRVCVSLLGFQPWADVETPPSLLTAYQETQMPTNRQKSIQTALGPGSVFWETVGQLPLAHHCDHHGQRLSWGRPHSRPQTWY